VELSRTGGTDNEQCLITKVLGRATGMTRLKLQVKNLTVFCLGESSDKALSVKHAYQAELKDPTV